jgi:uncharacterized protein with HEPN domain
MPREPQPSSDRERLEHMLIAAKEAIQYAAGKSRADMSDPALARLLRSCLQDIGEAASRVTDATRARTPALPWPKMVGMRHILVHAYFSVDLDVVWRVTESDLPILIAEVESALAAWPLKQDIDDRP